MEDLEEEYNYNNDSNETGHTVSTNLPEGIYYEHKFPEFKFLGSITRKTSFLGKNFQIISADKVRPGMVLKTDRGDSIVEKIVIRQTKGVFIEFPSLKLEIISYGAFIHNDIADSADNFFCNTQICSEMIRNTKTDTVYDFLMLNRGLLLTENYIQIPSIGYHDKNHRVFSDSYINTEDSVTFVKEKALFESNILQILLDY